jgi:hypothetical protein
MGAGSALPQFRRGYGPASTTGLSEKRAEWRKQIHSGGKANKSLSVFFS